MGQELIPAETVNGAIALGGGAPPTPFFSSREVSGGQINAGAVNVEIERAIAEAQGQMILAKRFPRDLNAAYTEMMEACRIKAMADVAFYAVPRGGGEVTGPSIRLAEELARVSGNISYGHKELSRGAEQSEVEVFAVDVEKNVRRVRQITVPHYIDTRNGPKKCRDNAEVNSLIANQSAKIMRGLILSIIPAWLRQAAIDECKRTLAGQTKEPIAQRVRKMLDVFSGLGVTPEQFEAYLGHSLEGVTPDELIEMTGIYNAIKEGANIRDYFQSIPKSDASGTSAAEDKPRGKSAILSAAKAGQEAEANGGKASGDDKKPTLQAEKAEPAKAEPKQEPETARTVEEEKPKLEPAQAQATPAEVQQERDEMEAAAANDPPKKVDLF